MTVMAFSIFHWATGEPDDFVNHNGNISVGCLGVRFLWEAVGVVEARVNVAGVDVPVDVRIDVFERVALLLSVED